MPWFNDLWEHWPAPWEHWPVAYLIGLVAFLRLTRFFGGPAAPLIRFANSRHVLDLRLIIALVILVVVPVGGWVVGHPTEFRLSGDPQGDLAIIGGVITLLGGVTAWAYRAGIERLGIVDLFACEITTLCRICAVVDLTRRHVFAFNADLCSQPDPVQTSRIRSAFSHFDAVESYTPIFDQSASELRGLHVKIVVNVTAFYTYFKALKDSLRVLANTDPPRDAAAADDAWHQAMRNVIYMQFLAFESARKAVRDLIEFQPNRVANTITILINEVWAYAFLLGQFKLGDFRYVRLQLRREAYQGIVEKACRRARKGLKRHTRQWAAKHGWKTDYFDDETREWKRAAESAKELENRWQQLFVANRPDRADAAAQRSRGDVMLAR